MKDLLRYSSLEFRHLRLVAAVAEARGLTRAAARLRLTPSALSHQLRQLEDLARGPIFSRTGKTMRLTPAGEMLLAAAQRALGAVHDAEEQLRNGTLSHAETIRLCAHCYTSYQWLPPVIRSFHQTHDNVDVRITPEGTSRPFEALRERSLDLVLTFDAPADRRFSITPLFRDELVLVVPAFHRLARRAFVDVSELAEEHLMLYSDSLEESYFARQHLFTANIYPKRFTSLKLTEAILEMVRAGMGVTILARWAAADAFVRKTIVAKRLTRRGLMRTWYAVTRERPEKEGALAALIQQLQAYFVKVHRSNALPAARKSKARKGNEPLA